MYETVIEKIKRSVAIDGNGCWIWQRRIDTSGYAQLKMVKDAPSRTPLAHRVSYEVFIGPIPKGLQIDHLCRVTACVNPQHLEPVTAQENVRRATRGGPKAECKYGHPLTEANSLRTATGRRCRECSKRFSREHKARQRARKASQNPT